MKNFFKAILRPILGRKAFQRFFYLLHQFSLKGMNYGGGADFRESGEAWVLQYVQAKVNNSSAILFDVGANEGGYSLAAARILKGWKIYAFEPAPKTFAKLQQVIKGASNINIHNIGLSSKAGQANLNFNEDVTGLASLYERGVLKDINTASVPINLDTLDGFCERNAIKKINFLKLDVEGHELEVLKGARSMLKNRAIDFIQFEFGGTDVDARVFLKDFFELLGPSYAISRILKDGLMPVVYSETEEIFTTTNYFAELK